MEVKPSSTVGSLNLYNLVSLEKYTRWIAEVDYDWSESNQATYAPEAVKAQAVAARTYAVAKAGVLEDNQSDQVYRGYSSKSSIPGSPRRPRIRPAKSSPTPGRP